MSARRLSALVLAATTTLLSAPYALALSEKGKKAYQEGVRALNDEELDLAARKLREAVSDDPVEGKAKFRGSGVNYEDYFPHLYLGLALEKLGRAAEAVKELSESQRQDVSRQRGGGVYARLTQALQRAQAAADAVAQARPTPTPTVPPPATPTSRPAAPTSPIPTATATPRPVPTLRPTALPAPTIAVPTAAVPPPPLPTARPTIIPIPPPEPRDGGKGPEELLADLKSGIRAYFRGDYDAAIRVLEKRREASGTARLFLAYSLAGKYLIGATRDEGVLARAREEYRAAQAAGAPTREDRLISRAVRAILEKG